MAVGREQVLRQPRVETAWRLTTETPLFVVGVLVSVVILGLITVVLWTTFLEGMPGVAARLSLVNYRDAFLSPGTYKAGLNSLMLGVGTVLVNLFFAVPSAWLIQRTNMPCKTLFVTLMYLGIVVPGFLKAIAWILLLSPKIGLINQVLRTFVPVEEGPLSIYNLPGMAFLQGLVLAPVMFFMISAAFRAVDRQLEESAEVAGGHRLTVLRYVTGPIIMPALAAAAIYNFMTAVSIFEIPALLGAPTRIHVLSTRMFFTVHTDVGLPRYGLAGVYGVLLLVPMLIALYFYQKLLRRSHRYAVVTGKGYRPKLMDLGRWKGWGVAFVTFYFLLALGLPVIVLIWASVTPYIRLPSMEALASVSLDGYRRAFAILVGRPLVNTLLLMVSVSLAVVGLSTVISWIVLRTRVAWRYGLDTISMLPHATPHLAFAFALGFVALQLANVLPLYGTLTVIILAHSVAYISFGTRSINGALIQIHQELEDAARTCGGSRLVALRRVVLPLLAPALVYSGVWVGLLSYREVTMALFLQTPQNAVLATTIWDLWGANKPSDAAALGVIMFGCMASVLFVLSRLASRVLYGLRPW